MKNDLPISVVELLSFQGKNITPSHYKDVVDERSIIKLCGYPICQNKLENVSCFLLMLLT